MLVVLVQEGPTEVGYLLAEVASEILEDVLIGEGLYLFAEEVVPDLESGISVVVTYHR